MIRDEFDMIEVDAVAARLEQLRNRLADLDADGVKILAVTKGFGADAVVAAHAAGLHAIGENYAQELAAKAADQRVADLEPGVRWHFIGQLQSKRVRLVAPHVNQWQSVDRLKVGQRISTHAPGAQVMVQVNATGEPQKAGCEPTAVPQLVEDLRGLDLTVTGLMTVGRAGNTAETEAAFRMVADLADRLELPERSMGMSGDLEPAIRAGTTMVRVGTALFGPRPNRSATPPSPG